MSWMNNVGSLLERYNGGGAATSPQNAEQDFAQVAQHAPASAMSGGIAEAFRSNQTPPFGQMISGLFSQSNGEQKSGILNHLLGAAGPSALSGGMLGGLAGMLGGKQSVTPEQAQQVPPEHVQQLAEQAQKNDPSIVDKAGEFYSQHPTLVQGLGAGALALVMSKISQR